MYVCIQVLFTPEISKLLCLFVREAVKFQLLCQMGSDWEDKPQPPTVRVTNLVRVISK